ncbi:MAG: hypothetical protein QM644_07830 [Mobilitalea sp.]
MGVENLDSVSTAIVLERYVAFIGIILLTPICLAEQNKEIRDLVGAKYISLSTVYLIRLVIVMMTFVLLIGTYIVILAHNNCEFPGLKFFLGTLAEAVFLGGIGFCVYSLFDQIAVAYLAPIMYYLMSLTGGKQLLKNFYLFSMVNESYREKVFLAIAGGVLIIIGLLYPHMRRKISWLPSKFVADKVT